MTFARGVRIVTLAEGGVHSGWLASVDIGKLFGIRVALIERIVGAEALRLSALNLVIVHHTVVPCDGNVEGAGLGLRQNILHKEMKCEYEGQIRRQTKFKG